MKILSSLQIKELDAYTIKHEPIASIDLMERACKVFVSWFTDEFEPSTPVAIVCGTGNNGGDGLGIARMLVDWGYSVKVWIVQGGVPESPDFKANRKRLHGKIDCSNIVSIPEQSFLSGYAIIIDAIFGSGLSRPVDGIYAEVIRIINQADAIRVAVDVPSGLMAEKTSTGEIVKADYTVTFQLPKLAFLLPESYPFVGEWKAVNIGLSKTYVQHAEVNNFLLERKDVKKIIKKRSKFDHKGHFGHALLITGSYGKMGAAVLSAKAAMRSGVGLLTVHVPKCGYAVVQTAVPEAMASVDDSETLFSSLPDVQNYSAIGVGPGIGQANETVKAFQQLLEKFNRPLVLDADAINILGAHRELIHLLPKQSVLTPHPKEFERLVGEWKDDFDRLNKQREFSIKTGCVVVLKGAHTSVSTPEGKIYFNNTGNPGMATGGSGDVLTGLVTGLLAQGYKSSEAALMGVWLHGLAGDFAAQELSQPAMIATDIIDRLPAVFKLYA
jgi:ADP-dependent NAD(P)H-hydrate dehydratase / NAD(P)H-hydrate epimerase